MTLDEYEHLKIGLADILRAAASAGQLSETGTREVRDLLGRLAEDRFNVVVVGRFSRGKSSLMNALLGSERLPTGFVPLTSVITSVAYGTQERATLSFAHTRLFEDIALDDLARHITERGNPANRRRIRAAEIQLPVELLRRGFYFIDTPGLGSSIAENTRTTEAFLPQADAFVLVSSFDSPLSEEETDLLRRVHQSGRHAFVVLNKMDGVPREARGEIEAYVRDRLDGIFDAKAPAVHSVSAIAAIAARRQSNSSGYAASGMAAFEAALVDYVMRERRTHFLRNMSRRIEEAMLPDAPGRALLDRLGARLDAVPAGRAPAPDLSVREHASTLPECEICTRLGERVFAFLAGYQLRISRPGKERDDLAGGGGLCAAHMRQLSGLAAPTEICSAIAPVIDHYAVLLRRIAATHAVDAARELTRRLPAERTCPACGVATAAMRACEAEIIDGMTRDPAGSIERLSAVCLPHLGRLLEVAPPHAVRALLERHARILDRLGADMRRYALKKEGGRRDMASQEEFSAAHRAARILWRNPDAETGSPR